LVVLVFKGGDEVLDAATGMLIGAAAMIIAALGAIDSVHRFRAVRGSAVAVAAWLAAAAALYAAVLR
jgi:hypothetical protein